MDDAGIAELLKRMRSADAQTAWEEFLCQYSPILYQAARFYTTDEDAAADCYLNICEHLAQNGFRRLLKFKLDGDASFVTWLRVVSRNLCFDWHRKQSGRKRIFKSLHSLSQLDLDVYACRFECGLSVEETLQRLASTFPGLDSSQLAESELRIEQSLNSRQHWILSNRKHTAISADAVLLMEDTGGSFQSIPDTALDQESLVVGQERSAHLQKCISELPTNEQLLLQLRFDQDLTLEEIAQVAGLGDAQRAHRQISVILKKLRAAMA